MRYERNIRVSMYGFIRDEPGYVKDGVEHLDVNYVCDLGRSPYFYPVNQSRQKNRLLDGKFVV